MLPQEIIDLRTSLGMTQQQLAERLGFKVRSAVAHLEDGRRRPNGAQLILLEQLQKESFKKSKKKGD